MNALSSYEWEASLRSLWEQTPLWLKILPWLAGIWLGAVLARFFLRHFMALIRLDRFGERSGFSEFMRKGGILSRPSQLLGSLAYWLVLGWGMLRVAQALDMDLAKALLTRLDSLVPELLVSILLCIVGVGVVAFLSNLAGTLVRNAGYPFSEGLTQLLRWVGFFVVGVLAVENTGVGRSILSPLIQITYAALALGLALAFGLGCKDLARDFATKLLREMRERRRSSTNDLEG